jgi:hypothetical protein
MRMKFYIRKKDVIEAKEQCDLGNSVAARIYLYPHREMLDSLQECVTITPSEMTDHPSGMNPEGR